MRRIEKTIFISYRRTNVPWALAISKHLTTLGFDVFFDFMSINSGDFEQIITENIKARAHFLVLLAPSALDRCNDPKDWLRREIEIALETKRNIIPVLLEGFDFGAPETLKYLTGELENLRNYGGLNIYAEYFDACMQKLCERFLNISLDSVLHPVMHAVSSDVQLIVEKQKQAVAEEAQVDRKTLSAQEWYERAFKANVQKEKIRLYTIAIELDSKYAFAYNNRGVSYAKLKQYERAIEDYDQAIKLYPEGGNSYYNKACLYALQGLVIETTKWLRQALTKDAKQCCELARQDSDFDGIRGEAVFQKLLEEFCDKC